MASEVWTAVIGGVAGLATGAISSLVAPWAKWSIEKRRIDRQRRYALLDSWREGIAGLEKGSVHTDAIETTWYETLRPYLSKDVLGRLEKPRTFVVTSDTGRGVKDLFTSMSTRRPRSRCATCSGRWSASRFRRSAR
jgi:hypothetical protein